MHEGRGCATAVNMPAQNPGREALALGVEGNASTCGSRLGPGGALGARAEQLDLPGFLGVTCRQGFQAPNPSFGMSSESPHCFLSRTISLL